MTQPDETPDSLVPEADENLQDEELAPEETSRDLPSIGTDSDPASFLRG
ncbi:hypothetical protein [Cellulomonas aerilata]|uniref:Uncharacterized protein n=1 Tax=Cellulomonas aerilata TaxID=515326 RepID=A0A512DBE0_9CELL|nr:hypothetical protein [Cellulomonas aerilata]GEO33792.1 hypothetical protein CAE01nite_15170 [Cellulomonas aerilata]